MEGCLLKPSITTGCPGLEKITAAVVPGEEEQEDQQLQGWQMGTSRAAWVCTDPPAGPDPWWCCASGAGRSEGRGEELSFFPANVHL